MPEQIPFYHVGATSTSNPFATSGIDWCPRCKKQVDTDMAAIHQGTTFTFKRWCNECGRVIANGMWDRVCMITNRPLPPAAVQWTIKPGRDRR